jgi:hypothetical protein
VSFLIILFGRRILNTLASTLHYHRILVLSGFAVLLLLIAIYAIRKFYNRRRGAQFPVEDDL